MCRAARAALLLAVILCDASPIGAAPRPPLWGQLTPGPHDVGFRMQESVDASRPLASGEPRPLQVGLWYPARAGAATPFPYRRYLELIASEVRFTGIGDAERQAAVETALQRFRRSNVSAAACEAWLDAPTAAVWDAPAASGRFPRVLLAQGNNHSLHHLSVLAEFLASHGFLVISTPSQGRITAPPSKPEEVLPSAEEQAGDLAHVEALTRDLPQSDGAAAAVLGFSFGARSAFLDALRHPQRAALISLDGGLANALGKGEIEKAVGFDAGAFRVPVLHLYQRGDPAVQPDFDLLESLVHSDRLLVEMAGLRHVHFSSLGMVASRIAGFESLLPDGVSVQSAWENMAQLVLDFLDATLRAGRGNRSFPSETASATFAAELDALRRTGTIIEWKLLSASDSGSGP